MAIADLSAATLGLQLMAHLAVYLKYDFGPRLMYAEFGFATATDRWWDHQNSRDGSLYGSISGEIYGLDESTLLFRKEHFSNVIDKNA